MEDTSVLPNASPERVLIYNTGIRTLVVKYGPNGRITLESGKSTQIFEKTTYSIVLYDNERVVIGVISYAGRDYTTIKGGEHSQGAKFTCAVEMEY
ncbi:hypothetical protein AMATHDRAFT_11290 [Amanita thiersii Skay4041]|uniref:Uncharacterized protein n=1 Tax=Amanita thiersii Skay4041 TaxID=703135 RepID=A0A2A9NAA6_9AGAR|nr:hypothetical protein AMATHDRAFT_11290 [Amanita thiersii Skay4041]